MKQVPAQKLINEFVKTAESLSPEAKKEVSEVIKKSIQAEINLLTQLLKFFP